MFAERDRGRRYVLAAEKAGQCGLPKDRLEPGESERQAALREIWEECGAKAALLPGFRREVSYHPVGDAVKGVSFFLDKCEAWRLCSRGALVKILPLSYAQALECLNHGYSKQVLQAAEACLTQKRQNRVDTWQRRGSPARTTQPAFILATGRHAGTLLLQVSLYDKKIQGAFRTPWIFTL